MARKALLALALLVQAPTGALARENAPAWCPWLGETACGHVSACSWDATLAACLASRSDHEAATAHRLLGMRMRKLKRRCGRLGQDECATRKRCRWIEGSGEDGGAECVPVVCRKFGQVECKAPDQEDVCQWFEDLGKCKPRQAGTKATPGKGERPNILLITLDDWRELDYGDTASNIEALKADPATVEFTNAYAQFPQCGPSRASFLSGRQPFNNGIYVSDLLPREYQQKTLFVHKHLKERGYRVGMAGKVYHTRTTFFPEDWFDETDATTSPSSGHLMFPFTVCGSRKAQCTCRESEEFDKRGTCRDYSTMRKASDWIRRWNDPERPWFVSAGFVRPHSDWRFPDWVKRKNDLPLHFDPQPTASIPDIARTTWGRNPCGSSDRDLRTCVDGFVKAVHYADSLVGNLLDTVRETGQWSNTLVVVHSDHGMQMGDNFRHFAKWTLFDASLKVPLIVKPPSQGAGATPGPARQVHDIVELVDLFPTLADWAGAPTDGLALDGQSLRPHIEPGAGTYSKADAVSVLMACRLDRSGARDLPCTTRDRGGDRLFAMGLTVRTPTGRFTEWRKLRRSSGECGSNRSQDACESKSGCAWRQYVYWPDRPNNSHNCIPRITALDDVDWSPGGLIAAEHYDNDERVNLLAGEPEGTLPPVDVRQIFAARYAATP